jgi:GT2 family glycosyltransferase
MPTTPQPTTPGALRVENLSAPSAVRSVDAERALRDLQLPKARSGQPYRTLAALVRRGPRPIGWLELPVPASGVVPATTLREQLDRQLTNAAGWSEEPDSEPLADARAESALVSVIVTTCADAAATVPCVHAIVTAARGPMEVIVVENRPAGSSVGAALERAFGGDARVRFVAEPQPGLSRARNAGLREARGEIVAFVDDDVTMDEHWFEQLRRVFSRHPVAACVTGLILPLEFETDAQLLIQRMAAFEKGFARRMYSLRHPPPDQPLFPYTAGFLGSGANMAFRRDVLEDLGGFDPALGAGSLALGGEDLDIYVRLLLSGRTLVYEPATIVWHRHPDTVERLVRQAVHYGVGLGAMVAKHLVTGPERRAIVRRIPRGVSYLLSPRSRKNAVKGGHYPKRLDWLERLGLLLGPVAYLRSRRRSRSVDIAKQQRETAHPDSAQPSGALRTVWCGELEVASPQFRQDRIVSSDGRPFDEARLLIRIHGEPAGFIHVPLSDGRIEPGAVWEAIERRLCDEIQAHLAAREADADLDRTLSPSADADVSVTVIVCSRDRAAELSGCLRSLQRLRHPALELLVVDNAPSDGQTKRLVTQLARNDPRLRYVCEPRPGLSCARNRGLREARGEVVAFTDDDVRVDPLWLAGLLRGFRRTSDVACVTGLVASSSLEHPAEQYFDGRVWWSSSCDPRVFRAARGPGDSRLHPYAAGVFGTGANIAFKADVIRGLGGFDESLGAGSPTAGGEDLDAFVRVLTAGYALSYEPAALAWHEHRVDAEQLQTQMYGYGKGLSAYLFKHLLSWPAGPRLAARMLLVLQHAILLGRRSRSAAEESGMPAGLMSSEVRGLLAGPRAYLRARRQQATSHLHEVAP